MGQWINDLRPRQGSEFVASRWRVAPGFRNVTPMASVRLSAASRQILAGGMSVSQDSESLVRYVAVALGDTCDLGKKGRRGILKSAASRRVYLSDPKHRIRFVYLPKHRSWLDQVECWFGILVRRLLKRGSFRSVEELKARILAFVEYFNQTMAKPMRWTYTGRPLA